MNITPATITPGATATATLQSITTAAFYLWDVNGGTLTPVASESSTSVTLSVSGKTSTITVNAYAGASWTGPATANGVILGTDITGTGTASIAATFSAGSTHVVNGGFEINAAVKVLGFNSAVTAGHYCTWRVTNSVAECMLNGVSVKSVGIEASDRLKVKLIDGYEAYFYKNNVLFHEGATYPKIDAGFMIAGGGTIKTPRYHAPPMLRETGNLQAYSKLTVDPSYPVDFTITMGEISDRAEDESKVSIHKTSKNSVSLTFTNRPKSEWDALEAFWQNHGTALSFTHVDFQFPFATYARFSGPPKCTITRANIVTYYCTLIEA